MRCLVQLRIGVVVKMVAGCLPKTFQPLNLCAESLRVSGRERLRRRDLGDENARKHKEIESHQLSLTSDTACLGRTNFNITADLVGVTQRGESSACSCPADSSAEYCSSVSVCGEPILFHASKALL